MMTPAPVSRGRLRRSRLAPALSAASVAWLATALSADTAPANRPRLQQTWGDARLVENLRIGVIDGDTNYIFGAAIQGVTVGRDGSIYVIDRGMSAGANTHLRQYTSAGKLVRTIGRYGQGPGEFGDPLGIAIASNGDILMFDSPTNRILVYDSAGRPRTPWTIPTQGRSTNSRLLVPDNAGGAFVPAIISAPGQTAFQQVVFHFNARGVADTIPIAECDHPPGVTGPFQPTCVRLFHPAGGYLVGWSESYAFDLRVPGKPVHFERQVPLERLQPKEEAEQAARVRTAAPQVNAIRVVPMPDGRTVVESTMTARPTLRTTKPAYKTFLNDLDGRVWVQVSVKAEKIVPPPPRAGAPTPQLWVEPVVYDVFQPDGRYSGRVRMPASSQFRTARGEQMWGVVRGEYDEAYIVRWRIVPAGR